MTRPTIASACLVLLGTAGCAHTTVVGRYEHHYGLSGDVVEIREDGTFSYESYTDLGGSERTSGRWRRLAPDLLIANTDPLTPTSSLVVTSDKHIGVVVEVKDWEGREFPGAEVAVLCGDTEHDSCTDSRGIVAFPECARVTLVLVTAPGFSDVSLAGDATTGNHFLARMLPEVLTVHDDLWYIHNSQLFFLQGGLLRVPWPKETPNSGLQ
jgi:hypothetical protein